jgi:ribonuclease P protein component
LRLRTSSDFQRLRVEGRKWQQSALSLSVAPNHLPHNRYGFIISKRLGKAIVRNRLRRHLQVCVRALNDQLLPGYDMVFIAKQAILTLDYQGICDLMIRLFRQAGLWVVSPP